MIVSVPSLHTDGKTKGRFSKKTPAVSLAVELLGIFVQGTLRTIPRQPWRKVKVFKDFDEVRRKGPIVLPPVFMQCTKRSAKNTFLAAPQVCASKIFLN